jgi:glycosyltransferase involved in cell wall biosynthesis
MITVICCTYGRSQLLSESIECFLRQDYLDSQMLILNDCPEQTLIFSHPRVHILNFPERFGYYGDKLNHALSQATTELVSVWDDDDIYLPGFLTQMASLLPRFRHGRAAKPPLRWTETGNRYLRIQADGYMNCVLTERKLLQELGGYARVHYSVEVDLLHRMVNGGWLCGPGLEPRTCPQYIYRIPSGRLHMTDVQTEEVKDRLREDFLRAVALGSEPTGTITLVPHWKTDYQARAYESWEHYGERYANGHQQNDHPARSVGPQLQRVGA